MVEADPSLLNLRTGQGAYGERPPSSYHIYFWTIGQNRSPVQVAEQFDQAEAVDVIRAFLGPKQLFLHACASADAEAAHRLARAHPQLMRELTPDDQRALADAAWTGDASAVELMMDLGFDPAVRGHDGGNALHCAAWEGSPATVRAILRHEDRGRLLHDRDPNYDATPVGWCCHGAVHCGNPAADHAAVMRLLLEAGADPPDDTADLPEAVKRVIREYVG
jgi:hypothetical protein